MSDKMCTKLPNTRWKKNVCQQESKVLYLKSAKATTQEGRWGHLAGIYYTKCCV